MTHQKEHWLHRLRKAFNMSISKWPRLFLRGMGLLLITACAYAAPPNTSTTVYPAVPPNISSSSSKPMLMLVASKDHTLFSPMFTDFEDLDGDGIIDVTFKPDFKYYGYFDASKCYLYQNSQFEPDTTATLTSGRYVCGGTSQWSGNFLNWATMTRLDTVRKMLYGGQRSTDSATETVLQIARLSRDSHSFVKYYNGTDIRDYTPFTTANLIKTTGDNANVYAGLTMCMQAKVNDTGAASTSVPLIRMAKGNYRMWATVEGGSVCNWDSGILGNKLSRYYGGTAAYQGNGGTAHESAWPTATDSRDQAKYGTVGPDLNARIKVCVTGKLGEERCQAYGSSSALVYKPVGLLQDFGTTQSGATSAKTEFGLITGSYDNNLKAGALRKNMNDLLDEIKPTTGQFCFSTGASCPTTALPDGRAYTSSGAINALDKIILYGKTSGNYDGSNNQLPSELTNGAMSAWGNPVGEMVVQALQYYGGQSSTNPSTTTKDVGASIPVTTWSDPLSDANTTRKSKYGTAICRPLNILALSSSALSFDGDDADTPFATMPNRSRGTLADFTNAVGAAEGIQGTLRSVGSVTGGFGETCTAKTVASLSNVSGVCPEAPAIGGTYKIAGAALYANTNRIRTVTSPPPDLPAWALKVKTYAASLAGGVTRIEVAIPNTNPKKYVYITPEGLWAGAGNAKIMPSAMLTFSAISSSITHGAFMVTWNDALFGGDYDMDIAGYLRYDILDPVAPSTKYRLKITTDIVNVGAGYTGAHGFSIIGSNGFDGRYLTHRHRNVDSVLNNSEGYLCGTANSEKYRKATDLSTITLSPPLPPVTGNGTQACNVQIDNNNVVDRDSPVTLTFEMLGAESVTLRDPLWYAAKYGSFIPAYATSSTELPDTSAKWDSRRNDGKACGGTTGLSCQDGEPDGYFLARRPDLLEQQLRATLEAIINTTNSAPAVSSSQLSSGSFKYIATFEPSQNSGSIIAYEMNSSGDFSNTPKWEAGQKLTTVAPASRVVITNDGVTGNALSTTASLSTDFMDALRGTGTGALTTAQGDELVNYLRGERSKEKPAGIWRARSVSNIMGSIVNSSPWLQSRPSAQNLGTLPTGTPSYATFVTQQAARERLIWVGANDGMLHGFKAQGNDGGAPVLSYLPSPLVNRLSAMTQDSTTIISGMDGSPYTGDVLIGSGDSAAWKTYLFSSLGRGGRAFFSLDVTNPSSLTQANAGNIFKWMFSSSDDADLGYVIGDQQLHPTSNQAAPIVRMNNNKYAVLLPNGVGSGNGRAALFVLFVDGPASDGTWTAGTHYVKIPTDNLTGNGLMGVNWVDTNNDGKADILYGTDFKGRLWKFDVSSSTTSSWSSAFTSSGTPVPLFEAKNGTEVLPVTTAPSVSFPSFGGVMVAFGTGSAISTSDFPDASRTQRFISIYDRASWTAPARTLPNSNLSTLVQRTLTRLSSGDVYISTGNTAFDKDLHDGWYINFAALASGSTLNNEMVLSSPQIRNGSLFFTTVRPTTASSNKCFADPEGTLYSIDPITGTPKVALLGTVNITVNGSTIKVNKAGGAIGDQKITLPVKQSGSNANIKIVGQRTNMNLPEYMRLMRRQWREIPGMRTN